MSLPPIGGEVDARRVCTRDIAWPTGVLCGSEAFLHVDWGESWGFVCERHTRELTAKGWRPQLQHEMGDECGMPGAIWDYDENRCRVPDDEPERITESVVAVGVADEAGG